MVRGDRPGGGEEVGELLEEILSLTEGLSWEIGRENVLLQTGMTEEEYHRLMYSERHRSVRWASPRDSYGPDNVGELVDLLTRAGYDDAEKRFVEAGYYFSEGHLLTWLDFFISVSMSRMQSHMVRQELLETALSGCMDYRDAFEFYFRTQFDSEEMIDFACRLYLERNGICDHILSRATLAEYIRTCLARGKPGWGELCYGLYQRLYQKAVEWEYLEGENVRELPREIGIALRALGFHGLPSEERLKARYRNLLRQYHPDVNPGGEEKTREIIAYYTILIQYLSQVVSSVVFSGGRGEEG